MMYVRYIALVLLGIVVTILNVLLSPILPLFIRAGQYPKWLSWFQTADAPAWGDEAFHKREMAWANWMLNWMFLYISAIFWACRNPGYGYDHWAGVTVKEGFTLVEDEDCTANISRDENMQVTGTEGTYKRKLINGDGKEYFEYCKVWVSPTGIGHKVHVWFRVHLGWHLHTIDTGVTRNLKLTFNRW